MKKVLTLCAVLLLLTACGKTDIEKLEDKYGENNEVIKEELEKITLADVDNYFSSLFKYDLNGMETNLGLSTKELENFVVAMPHMNQPKFYMILKPKADKDLKARVIRQVEQKIDTMENQIRMTSDTATDEESKKQIIAQADLIKNHLKEEYKGYLIYICSPDNEKVLETIKKYIDKE